MLIKSRECHDGGDILRGGMVFHVLNRGGGRRGLFTKDEDFLAFERVVEETLRTRRMRLCAYCLMPNHWHFVVWPERDGDLPAFMQQVTNTHVKRWKEHRHEIGYGHLYQGRYKCIPVETEDYFCQVVRYVERNALRANLGERAESWRWSTLRRVEREDPAFPILSAWPLPRPTDWLQIVNQRQTEAEVAALRCCVNRGRPFGDPNWVTDTAKRFGAGMHDSAPWKAEETIVGLPRLLVAVSFSFFCILQIWWLSPFFRKERGENTRTAPCWKASRDRSTVGSVTEDQLHVEHVVHQHRPGGELILVGDSEDQVLAELVIEADGVGEVVQAHDLAGPEIQPAAAFDADARYIPAALVVVEPVGLVERDELAKPAVDVGSDHEIARVRVVQRDVLAERAHKVPVIPELLAYDAVNTQQAVTVPLENIVIPGGRFILHDTREQELVLHVADQDVLGTGHDVRHREDRAGALGREPDQAILVGEQLEPIGDRKAKLESVNLEGPAADHRRARTRPVPHEQEPGFREGARILRLDRVAQRSGEAVEGMIALEEPARVLADHIGRWCIAHRRSEAGSDSRVVLHVLGCDEATHGCRGDTYSGRRRSDGRRGAGRRQRRNGSRCTGGTDRRRSRNLGAHHCTQDVNKCVHEGYS